MKTSLIVLAAVFSLSACSMEVEGFRVNQANEICSSHGGVSSIGTIIFGVTCQDGYATLTKRIDK